MKITQEGLKTVGEAGLKIGKQIVIEGTKAVIMKGAFATVETGLEKGLSGIKGMTLDKFLTIDEESKLKREAKAKAKKAFFKKITGRKTKETEIVDVEELINNVKEEVTEGE